MRMRVVRAQAVRRIASALFHINLYPVDIARIKSLKRMMVKAFSSSL